MKVLRNCISICCAGFSWMLFAATGASPEFRLDLRGLGPWQRHTAAASEEISYSSDWANLRGAECIVNGGFENAVISGNEGKYAYFDKTSELQVEAWAGSGSGLTISNTPWTKGVDLPIGDKAAFIQRGGRFYQDIVVPTNGQYELSFVSAPRVSKVLGHQVNISVDDGDPVLTIVSDSSNVVSRAVSFYLSAGSHRITFSGVTAVDDVSTIIDNVSLRQKMTAVVKVMPVLKTKPKYLVIDLSGGTNATHYPITSLDEVPGGSWSDEYKTSKLVLRHIPAGSFIMGGRATDYPGAVNTNLHMVTITRDFYMGVFEVTQRQWELVMGTRPSSFTNVTCYAKRPVESVRYIDIRGSRDGVLWPKGSFVDEDSFMGVVRRKTGMGGFDLPTESQWEYTCRAGTSTALNSGRNLSGEESSLEMDEVGRYRWNSGLGDNPRWREELANATTEVGTANVGSYISNLFGCYDMHGNAWEWCLDRAVESVAGSVDPVGDQDGGNAKRSIKGGSIINGSGNCISGVHYSDVHGFGFVQDGLYWTLGFRLCLQGGGDVPDFAAASTLVNEAGAGSQSWTPTRAGAYYLTHSTMNGATNVQLQSAWFEVPGCQLTLEPQGELTNGVSVAITGAGEGWTIYYTTNGLAPSQASEKYTGPFSLPESATVRAVAYNTQGVASEETTTSFTLHDALSVVGAVARPRYPWNGMVDIDCEINGDPEAKYVVELVAMDLEGGTNLMMKTVLIDGGALGDRALPPGEYRLTWNADKDIAYDHDFPRVAVTVKARLWVVENLRVIGVANATGGVSIAWNALDGASRYRVYKGADSAKLLPVAIVTDTFFRECNQTGTAYYAVAAMNASGDESGLSAPIPAIGFTTAVTDGLVAYYPFNGDNQADYSGYGRDLDDWRVSLIMEDHDRIGRPNCAAGFSGTNYVVRSEVWEYTNDVSVALWFKAENEYVKNKSGSTDHTTTFMIFPIHGGNQGVAGLGIIGGTNCLSICEHKGDFLEPVGIYSNDFGVAWHHVAVTVLNNGAPDLYVDGQWVMSAKATGYKIKISNGCSIGGGPYGQFKGSLDDVRFYNRALTADEVRTLYNWVDENGVRK